MYFKRIKELREDNDYKQIFIAQLLGIKQNTYSQIENGTSTITVEHLIKLCNLYHVSADYILNLKN